MNSPQRGMPFGMPDSEGARRDGDGALCIGELMLNANKLLEEHIERVLSFQRQKGIRFGEAAVALRLVERADVVEALSRQYRFPYAASYAPEAYSHELVMAANPFSEQAESFRRLRSELLLGGLGSERSALAVVSANPGDGKSYVAANLAVALSQLGAPTLLIDADLRTPRQHRLFGVHAPEGLSTLLAGRSGWRAVQQIAELPSLHLLPAGPTPPNPLELLQGSELRRLLGELVDRFEYVIADSAAASRGADGRVLAATLGAALLIGRKNRTRVSTLDALIGAFGSPPVTLAGVLINEH